MTSTSSSPSVASQSELNSLQNAIQFLLDGIHELIRITPQNGKNPPLRSDLMETIQFASDLLDWCGKIPPQRIRDTLYSLIRQLYRFLLDAVREGRIRPPENNDDSLLPRLREVLMELGPSLTVNFDRMAAFVVIPEDMALLWSIDALKECLKRRNIVYGVDEDNLQRIFLENKFDQLMRAALGKTPVLGSDAKIESMLQLSGQEDSLPSKSSKRVDYKSHNLFVQVKTGQVILKKIPAKSGENGYDIYGRTIESPTGLDVEMPIIDNCERDETGLHLVSKVDGCAYSSQGRIYVTPALAINGNVDFETGNIKTSVSVTINKDILATFRVESDQDVAVRGVIESAEVFAGGSVFCQGGIHGKGGGVIRAGKNVESAHVNGVEILAGGFVLVNGPIIKSTIRAKRITSIGKNGQIMGGSLHAWEDIYACEIGSEMGIRTDLILGEELPQLKAQVEEITQRLKAAKHQKAQAEYALKQLRASSDGAKPQIDDTLKKLKKINIEISEIHKQLDSSMKDLAYSESCSRMVRAATTIYAGTRIQILDRALTIKEQRGPTNIVYAGDRLVPLPFEERSFTGDEVHEDAE